MNCATEATLSDIAYCQGADALIHIGELETYSGYEIAEDLWIRFEDMAVGTSVVIPIRGQDLPELVIDSEDFTPTPGHVYRITVARAPSGGGITPLRVKPFEVTYIGYTIAADAFDALLVRFIKVFTSTPTVVVSTEQWLSLPS